MLNIFIIFKIKFLFNKTALYSAIEKENTEIVKILLTNDSLDINNLNTINNSMLLYNFTNSFK